MHYPCEFYAKYLLLLDRGTALRRLEQAGYRYQAEHLDDLLESISPVPDVTVPLSGECLEWAQVHQIYGMLARSGSPEMADILRVFRNYSQRQLLESLLVMNLYPDDVLNLFKAGSGVELSEGTMKRYQHYFWNARIMSRLDWYNFLFDGVAGLRFERYANANDLWAYMHLPAQLALYKAGFAKYANIDKAKALDDLFGMAYMKAMEEAQVGNTPNFQKTAMVAIAAFSAGRTTSTDISDVLARLTGAVKLTSAEFHVESIDAVSGGHHSAGGGVLALPARRTDASREPEGDRR